MAEDLTKKVILTKEDGVDLMSVANQALERHGLSADDISLMSSKSVAIQSMQTQFSQLLVALMNNRRESSILTMQNPSSIYNELVKRTDELILATPSKIDIRVSIPMSDIETYGTKVQTNTWELVYTNDNIISLDKKEFKPIQDKYYIRVSKKTKEPDVRVYYYNSEQVAVDILAQKLWADGEYQVYFTTTFWQVSIVEDEASFNDPELDKFIFTTAYPIHQAKATYADSLGDTYRDINLIAYFQRGSGEFLTYKYTSNTSLVLTHQYRQGGFLPVKNGSLKVTFVTTTGENVQYSGVPALTKVVPEKLSVSYYSVDADGVFRSTGGSLAPNSKEYLRSLVIYLNGTRGRIDTENDMVRFFSRYENYPDGGSSVFRPKMVVNDVKMRIFNIYTGLSFKSKLGSGETRVFTIPTNSGSTIVDTAKLPSKTINGMQYFAIRSDMTIKSTQSELMEEYVLDPDGSVPFPGGDNQYEYLSPFLYSYSFTNNFARTFMDAQFDTMYLSDTTFNSDDPIITTRFINEAIRVADYIDEETTERVTNIWAPIRADSKSFVLSNETFRCELELTDASNNPVLIPGVISVLDEENKKYKATFEYKTDRNIYDTFIDFTYQDKDKVSHTVLLNIDQTAKMHLYEIVTLVGGSPQEIHTVTYEAPIYIFQEVTPSTFIQTDVTYSGKPVFLFLPLVSKEFYNHPHNKQVIIKEILNIYQFIKTEVYDTLGMFKSKGFTLRDLQETLFSVSIKFAKTYGISKFLNVAKVASTPLLNLQVRPTIGYRLKDNDYDLSNISNAVNDAYINHDFIASDLHMDTLMSDIYTRIGDYVEALQFINFDNYPPDYHMLKENGKVEQNSDIPEIVSLAPKWNDELKTYEYDITFIEI